MIKRCRRHVLCTALNVPTLILSGPHLSFVQRFKYLVSCSRACVHKISVLVLDVKVMFACESDSVTFSAPSPINGRLSISSVSFSCADAFGWHTCETKADRSACPRAVMWNTNRYANLAGVNGPTPRYIKALQLLSPAMTATTKVRRCVTVCVTTVMHWYNRYFHTHCLVLPRPSHSAWGLAAVHTFSVLKRLQPLSGRSLPCQFDR